MRKALVLLTMAALLGGSALTGSAVARDRDRDREYRIEIRSDKGDITANQIIDQYSARVARIKADLRLTPDQDKNWGGFESATRDIAKTNADRLLAMHEQRAQDKGQIDVIEAMRREAKYLSDRSVDRKKLADAAAPVYNSLDDGQKRRFANELVGLSRWSDFN
jgi:hypothetical protein